jgi:CBS domain-containing protein
LSSALQDFHCASPLFPNNFGVVVHVLDSSSISEGFEILLRNKILSAPIVSKKEGKLVGILTIMDIVQHILKTFKEKDLKPVNIAHTIHKHQEFSSNSVLSIKERAEPIVEINATASILDAAKAMIEKKVHRIVVVDEKHKPVNMITLSRVIKLASVLLDSIPQASKTLRELALGCQGVISVQHNSHVRAAFELMKEKKISSVGILDGEGKLVGSLSISDIKLLGYDARFWELLTDSVESYLAGLRLRDASRTIPDEKDPIRCTPETTLASCVKMMTFYDIHRLFVVDNNQKPLGVVSLEDALPILLQ